MDDLEWKAGLDKLKNKGWTDANSLSNMKSQWKSVFQNKADEIFEVIWENQNLRNNLFEDLASNKDYSKALFSKLINDTDDRIFKFLIVE